MPPPSPLLAISFSLRSFFFVVGFSYSVFSIIIRDGVQYPPELYRISGSEVRGKEDKRDRDVEENREKKTSWLGGEGGWDEKREIGG